MITLLGLVAKLLSFFIPIKRKSWILGADYGKTYREGSKYLLEYMLANHSDYDCCFITRNVQVKNELDEKGIPCELNFSIKGIWKVLRAEYVFTTQTESDIIFVYKKSSRTFIYLCHGQPYKAVFLASPKEYLERTKVPKSWLFNQWYKLARKIDIGYSYLDSKFYISTSEELIKYNKMYFGQDADIRVLGMPRNDGLFDDERMRHEKWLDNIDDKFVITYMPTHRDYGKGKCSPIPFIANKDVQKWMRDNNVVLIVKQHPNMVNKIENLICSDVIIDISKMNFDPQVVLFHSKALITDFSSVWIDYLILQRPLLFYLYDNYETDDTGKLYDITKEPTGHFCYTEEELFSCIVRVKCQYESMKPSPLIVKKYHNYLDGHSCERLFNSIIEDEKVTIS